MKRDPQKLSARWASIVLMVKSSRAPLENMVMFKDNTFLHALDFALLVFIVRKREQQILCHASSTFMHLLACDGAWIVESRPPTVSHVKLPEIAVRPGHEEGRGALTSLPFMNKMFRL
jgi:hypothetical protein